MVSSLLNMRHKGATMGIEDLAKQAGEFVKQNSDTIQSALKSEQAEEISDKLLDGAADLANKVTGDKFKDQVAAARNEADKHIGDK
jgi:hypothetical protein